MHVFYTWTLINQSITLSENIAYHQKLIWERNSSYIQLYRLFPHFFKIQKNCRHRHIYPISTPSIKHYCISNDSRHEMETIFPFFVNPPKNISFRCCFLNEGFFSLGSLISCPRLRFGAFEAAAAAPRPRFGGHSTSSLVAFRTQKQKQWNHLKTSKRAISYCFY